MTTQPTTPRTYPHGVPNWIDTEQPDLDAASHFYGDLFGWTFEKTDSPYLIAKLHGADVAGIGATVTTASWNTYIAVDNTDSTTSTIETVGGRVTNPPHDVASAGRTAIAVDPHGVEFRLWQARKRLGAQVVNSPGAWNFSILHSNDRPASIDFYTKIFGWKESSFDPAIGSMITVPGYGQHLANTVDPDIYERQQGAPDGFADVAAGIADADTGEEPHWHVYICVEDRDESAMMAEKLDATVIDSRETQWTHEVTIRDPQGAILTLSQFTPPV